MNTIDDRMFDFKSFYDGIVHALPNDSVIVEVGVADGASALYLAHKLRICGKPFKLYMVDSLAYGGPEQLSTIIKNVQLSGLGEFVEIMPFDSLIASTKFNDNSIDFCFLDSSHTYPMTKAEIYLWMQKIKNEATLAGHDYNDGEGAGVKQAVDELLPRQIQRPPIPEQQEFEPEGFLETYDTEKGCGVWAVKKRFYFSFPML